MTLNPADDPSSTLASRTSLRDLPAYLLVAAIVFIILFPTLPWQQFGGDSEDLLVQPVLEMRHGGPWWIPTLGGQPRIRKPPLPTWITAAAVRPATVSNLSSANPLERESAYRALAIEARWPALLAACLTLVAVGLTGQILAGRTIGIVASIFCGTTYLFLQSARKATTDPYLALFVAFTNLFLALAIFERRYWLGFTLGGISLGLAFMAKGPVCLLQTVVPFVAYLAYRLRFEPPTQKPSVTAWLGPVVIGLSLATAIALPWYISVIASVQSAQSTFGTELAGEGAKNISHDPIYAYLQIIPCMMPWTGFFLLGWRRLVNRRILLAAFVVLVPLLVMTLPLFRDKKQRYIVPVLGPASILAAYGANALAKSKSQRTRFESGMLNFQWGTLFMIALGMPLAGVFLRTADGQAWHSPAIAMVSGIIGLALIALAIKSERRGTLSPIAFCALAMALPVLLLLHGLLRSRENLSEMKPIADRLKPYVLAHRAGQAAYFEPMLSPNQQGKPVTLDLDIYLDQPVPILHDASELTGPQQPAAIVMMTRTTAATTKPILPELPGWIPFFDTQAPKHPYHFWVLVPMMGPATAPASSRGVEGGG